MKIKKIIIIVLVLMLTGCSATVNIDIDSNLKVNEKDIISFDNISTPNASMRSYINSFLNYYKPTISYKRYSYEVKEGGRKSKVIFKKSSDNMCDLISTGLFNNQLYDRIECTEDELYINVKSVGQNSFGKKQSEKEFDVDDVTINITLPVDVIENNADSVSKNKYTWYYDKQTSPSKELYFKISKSSVEENKAKIVKKQKIKSGVNTGIKIIIVVAVFVGILYLASRLYDKYKQNRIDY